MDTFDKFRNCITQMKCQDCEGFTECRYDRKTTVISNRLALDVLNLLKEQNTVEHALKVLQDNGWKSVREGDET